MRPEPNPSPATAGIPLRALSPVEERARLDGAAPLSCVWEDAEGWHSVDGDGRRLDGDSFEDVASAGSPALH